MSNKSLNTLKEGQSCIVSEVNASLNTKRRLHDMGLIKNTKVKCLQKSPFGDPVAYLIRGTVIALRSEDSSKIKIAFN